jgi:hypothetical protein
MDLPPPPPAIVRTVQAPAVQGMAAQPFSSQAQTINSFTRGPFMPSIIPIGTGRPYHYKHHKGAKHRSIKNRSNRRKAARRK